MSDHGRGKPVDFQSEHRVFEYSIDNGATWLLCISSLRDDDVRQVQADLSARYGLPVVVRQKMPRSASVSTAAQCRSFGRLRLAEELFSSDDSS